MVDNMSKRGFDPLNYRFENEIPDPGRVTKLADGVFWLRTPMAGRLNHINCWLLRDYDGWTVVDTGIFGDRQKEWLKSERPAGFPTLLKQSDTVGWVLQIGC